MEANDIGALIDKAKEARLLGLDFLAQFNAAALAREYNGIGPEWCGAAVRHVVTEKFSLFEPAALIHDLRNTVSDGTELAFHVANQEFYINCRKLADLAYPWYSLRRYRARLIASAFFDFVEGPGGWRAWLEAHERFLSRQGLRLDTQKPSRTAKPSHNATGTAGNSSVDSPPSVVPEGAKEG